MGCEISQFILHIVVKSTQTLEINVFYISENFGWAMQFLQQKKMSESTCHTPVPTMSTVQMLLYTIYNVEDAII